MEALEAEQNHIDNRAGVVERKLRQLLETGRVIRVKYVIATHVCTTNDMHYELWIIRSYF